MSDILQRILARKREEVDEAKRSVPEPEMELRARAAPGVRPFRGALEAAIGCGRPAVIAEIKRASPSRGLIRPDFDPAALAASYAANGASCLSVLTDRDFFGGSLEDLRAARGASPLPVLRKDFIIDAYQVHEARAWGADCILLIMDAVEDPVLATLATVAREIGLDVLLECHDGGQLERARGIDASLIGINNRDLRTFETRLETTLELKDRVPEGKLLITESGIRSREDVSMLQGAGVSAYLIGGALMAAADPGAALRRLFFPC